MCSLLLRVLFQLFFGLAFRKVFFSAMAPSWLAGASPDSIRRRSDLLVRSCAVVWLVSLFRQVALEAYLGQRSSSFGGPWYDELVEKLLRGSHSLVLEAVFQSHDGQHVTFWAKEWWSQKGCSLALTGLLSRLEYTRYMYDGNIARPCVLVPSRCS